MEERERKEKGKEGRERKEGKMEPKCTNQTIDTIVLHKHLVETANRRKEYNRIHVIEERDPSSCESKTRSQTSLFFS